MIQNHYLPIFLLTAVGCGIGILLNKVITWLPTKLQADWTSDCRDFLGLSEIGTEGLSPMYQEHPPIAFRHQFVVLLAGLTTFLSARQFGLSSTGLSVVVLLWVLITLCFIDLETQLLPDTITLPLLWLGLLVNLNGMLVDLHSAVLGAALGYSSLWTIFIVFKWITKKEGMGHGDFKLLAAIGAWLGWQQLPSVVLLAGLSGLLVGLFLYFKHKSHETRIPFGPHLALAAGITILA